MDRWERNRSDQCADHPGRGDGGLFHGELPLLAS